MGVKHPNHSRRPFVFIEDETYGYLKPEKPLKFFKKGKWKLFKSWFKESAKQNII